MRVMGSATQPVFVPVFYYIVNLLFLVFCWLNYQKTLLVKLSIFFDWNRLLQNLTVTHQEKEAKFCPKSLPTMNCDVPRSSLLLDPHGLYEEKSNVFFPPQSMQMLLFEQNAISIWCFRHVFPHTWIMLQSTVHSSVFLHIWNSFTLNHMGHETMKWILKNMGYEKYFY